MSATDGDVVWLFGYGSLLWRPDFPWVARRSATMPDVARRLWQGSTDHRGVPEAPGRVVTLVDAPGAVCRGVAYALARPVAERVVAALDHRERDGYARRTVALAVIEAGEDARGDRAGEPVRDAGAHGARDVDERHDPAGRVRDAAVVGRALPEAPRPPEHVPHPALFEGKARPPDE